MSKFSNELYHLMEKAYMEDEEPIQLTFSNRVYRKYGKEFNKKYDFISGKNLEYIAEQLKSSNLNELDKMASATESSLLGSLKEFDELSNEELAPMMYVPEEHRPEWIAANTRKYFLDDELKRDLLEEYLSSLSETNRKKAIAVMCENSNSKNYYRFLELSTTAYTPNQEILSKDLINFFHNKYLNEEAEKLQTLQRFNQDVFQQQEMHDKKSMNDEIYNKTVRNRNYYNPYDANEMLTPRVSGAGNREFLDKNTMQDDLFSIIDQNSAMYLKQKTQFNNDHLNKDLLRRQQMMQAEAKAQQEAMRFVANNMPAQSTSGQINSQSMKNVYHYNDVAEQELINPSFVTEIPQFDNIADFIEQRAILNYQNTARKQHNVSTSVNYNNELTGAHIEYNPTANPYPATQYRTQREMRHVPAAPAPEGSIPAGEIHKSAMVENIFNNQTVMETAKENLAPQLQPTPAVASLSPFTTPAPEQTTPEVSIPRPQQIKITTPLSQLGGYTSQGLSMSALDPNATTNRINMVRDASMQNVTASPAAASLNNRFSETNVQTGSQFISSNIQQNQQVASVGGLGDKYRMADISNINSFFNKKAAPKHVEDNDKLEISMAVEDEMIKRPRKSQTRQSSKKQAESNSLSVIKINRAIVDSKKPAAKEEEKVQVKKAVMA